MKGVLSRGNLILAASWAMAIGMFLARAGSTNGGGNAGASSSSPRAQAPEQTVTVPVEPGAGLEIPVSVAPGEALSRLDTARPLP